MAPPATLIQDVHLSKGIGAFNIRHHFEALPSLMAFRLDGNLLTATDGAVSFQFDLSPLPPDGAQAIVIHAAAPGPLARGISRKTRRAALPDGVPRGFWFDVFGQIIDPTAASGQWPSLTLAGGLHVALCPPLEQVAVFRETPPLDESLRVTAQSDVELDDWESCISATCPALPLTGRLSLALLDDVLLVSAADDPASLSFAIPLHAFKENVHGPSFGVDKVLLSNDSGAQGLLKGLLDAEWA